ncbi:MAG: tRNA (adenosine(37)-N6)-dimethylallyltransferase MiaA [Candidatus Vogelbacteria bacterium RIFOXYD1_FULL_44_32]|uniref:tRNA dimethylallyltransferase n=1 Tax=Candidatus Vogelbacteria bacterium RIFOXYD1_FULL_44_32 TaxID=1802438 RepID=A0A1G2QD91_9BACT|nr:MAG: tRNA (adenosine(37)-N6)-dimethylallyltransferase MiaA [Candidatus Vogelbacteria bacterium RIFOXYD1_FULL_44_32]
MDSTNNKKDKLLVILGPTASGKSALAVDLAVEFAGEVISADSRQVYRGLDIGAGKVTEDEMRGVMHHLLDVADLADTFTVADFKSLATSAIGNISEQGKLPILAGGTGFYIQAVVDDLKLPEVPPDETLRLELDTYPTIDLVELLRTIDPDRASNIDDQNRPRLIRAIEIAKALGKVPPLEINSPYDLLQIGIYVPQPELFKKIHNRLLARVKVGLIEEVKNLKDAGITSARLEALGLEYRYISQYLDGRFSKDTMLAELEQAIRQYAKRQMSWFKRDNRIRWITEPEQSYPLVRKFLSQ